MENKKFEIREQIGVNTWELPDYKVKVTEIPGEGTLIEAPEELAPAVAHRLGEHLAKAALARHKEGIVWGSIPHGICRSYYQDDHGRLVTLIDKYAKFKLGGKNYRVVCKILTTDPLPDAILFLISRELRRSERAEECNR